MTNFKSTLRTKVAPALAAFGLFGAFLFEAQPSHAQSAFPRDDIALLFSNDASVLMSVNGEAFDISLRSGNATLKKEDRDCVPTFTTSCAYIMNTFEIRSNGFIFFAGGDVGTVSNVVLGVLDSQTAVDDGTGIGLLAGFPGFMSFNLDFADTSGRRFTSEPSPSGLRINLDEDDRTVTFLATFAATIEGIEIDFFINGAGEVRNLPPHANATAPQTVSTCSAEASVAVDGTASTDPEGQQLFGQWFENGVLLGQGLSGDIPVGPGVHNLDLTTTDTFGGSDTDSVTVSVVGDTTDPVFTFVPPSIQTSTCAGLQLGTPTATDDCGEVEITNDAPSQFSAGTTVVTWTAEDAAGNEETATQTVTVTLRNDPSCCPAGSNVILGTSNNDVRVGTAGPDCILGFGGQDQLSGAGGNDVISGGDGDDVINGGSGNDLMYAGSGQDRINAGTGDDLLSGDDGDDKLYGESGMDTLSGGQGQDQLFGGVGNDIAFGNAGDDKLFGEDGDDVLDGSEHNDQCTGGAGFDTMLSCVAQDTLENPGPPSFPGEPNYDVCLCRPNKCTDCSSSVNQCDNIVGCPQIIQCVQQAGNCNLPHECSALCESGRTQQAIDAARQLASCMGGC